MTTEEQIKIAGVLRKLRDAKKLTKEQIDLQIRLNALDHDICDLIEDPNLHDAIVVQLSEIQSEVINQRMSQEAAHRHIEQLFAAAELLAQAKTRLLQVIHETAKHRTQRPGEF